MALKTKLFNELITFTRASAATRTNLAGLIETTPVNLLTYSQEFDNAAWNKPNATVTANTTTAPDGTSTADTVNEGTATGYHQIEATSVTSTGGLTYSYSVYLKYIDRQYVNVSLWYATGSAYAAASFDIQNGTVSNTGSLGGSSVSGSSITPVGNGWYRCSIVVVSSATYPFNRVGFAPSDTGTVGSFGLNSFTGTSKSFYAWGAQLEQRSQASAYIPTTSSISGAPRFDYDPVTLQPNGLLIEEQRTNLLSASQDFEAPVWAKSNATVNANCVVAPDGTTTADKLVEATANAQHSARQNITTTAQAYAFSAYVKAAERTWCLLYSDGAVSGKFFDIANGVAGNNYGSAPTASSITPVGNGWYRVSITITSTAASVSNWIFTANGNGGNSYTGDGTSGIYIWGAQLEAGAFATSYVATPLSFTSRSTTATYRGTNGLIQTAAINTARYEPNSSGGSNLLLESAATNLLLWSEDFSNAAWTKSNATVTANSTTAPDGNTTADTLVANNGTTSNVLCYQEVTGLAAATAYTASLYVKAAGNTSYRLDMSARDSAGTLITRCNSTFDLSAVTTSVTNTGTFTSTSATISAISGGWYRVTITGTTPASTARVRFELENISIGDGTSGIYVWGAQFE